MIDAAPRGKRGSKAEKDNVAAGHEGGWQPGCSDLDCALARQRAFGNGGKSRELQDVVLAQSGPPSRPNNTKVLAHVTTHVELHAMALPIIESDRLDPLEAIEGPVETHR